MKAIIYFLIILAFTIFYHSSVTHKQTESIDRTENEADGLKDYLRYRRLSRADSTGEIPMNALLEAKEHIENMPSYHSRDAGLWEWDWLGPGNIGGRIRTILSDPDDPNTIWIGSVSGGIWKSTNGGNHWSKINDFLPSLAISSMVFNSQNKNIMYAGTGESYSGDGLPGAGIFKSTDGGITWNQLVSTNNDGFKYVNRLCAHPDSGNVIFAVTNANTLFKTVDGGASWDSIGGFDSRPLDVKLDPSNVNEIYVGCASALYISYDYGATWELQTTGASGKLPDNTERCEIGICESAQNKIYISMNRNGGELWVSTNNGTTWSLKNSGTEYLGNQGNYANAIWVAPDNADRLVVGGLDIYGSRNGGDWLRKISTWQNYHNGGWANSAHADQHCIVPISNYDSDDNPVIFVGNDGGIQKNTNVWGATAPSSWVNLATGTLGTTQFYGGAVTSNGSIILGGSQDNDKLRYKASGSWSGPSNWYQATTGDGGYCAIDFNNTNNMYGEYVYLSVRKSTDYGDSWDDAHSGITDAVDSSTKALFIAPLVMDPNNPSILVAGGSKIWRTLNRASSWNQIRDTIGIRRIDDDGTIYYQRCSAIDIAKDNSSLIWVGYENGEVARTYNGGVTWSNVDAAPMPDRYVTDIAINPNDENEVWVTFGGYNNSKVYFTDDAGYHWHNRDGSAPFDLPVIQVNTIRVNPLNGNYIYVGTDMGVFVSQNKGVTWSVTTHYPDNEGPANTEVDELFWQGDEFLIAATHGRGMYRTETPLVNVYVDNSAPSGGNGSQSNPYNNIYDAENNRGPGSNMIIETGTYNVITPVFLHKQGIIIPNNGQVLIKK